MGGKINTMKQAQPRQTVGIRELKQNPSDVVARAASGVQFDVLSNGKPAGVVIQRDADVRSRWVSTDALKALAALAGSSNNAGGTGWAEDLWAQRELDNDPIVDPWDASPQNADENAAEKNADTA